LLETTGSRVPKPLKGTQTRGGWGGYVEEGGNPCYKGVPSSRSRVGGEGWIGAIIKESKGKAHLERGNHSILNMFEKKASLSGGKKERP